MIETYTKNKATKLSTNFKSTEFDCNGSSCCKETKINPLLVEALQKVRTKFGKAVTLTRGYSCKKHNSTIKGAASKSQHLNGNAADFKVSGVNHIKVAYYIHNSIPEVKGLELGIINANYIHIDVSGDATSRNAPWNALCFKTGSYTTVPDLFPLLKLGRSGACVKMLTYSLQKLGYKVSVTSSYTATIRNAVVAFQTANGLAADGICGPKTWEAIVNKL